MDGTYGKWARWDLGEDVHVDQAVSRLGDPVDDLVAGVKLTLAGAHGIQRLTHQIRVGQMHVGRCDSGRLHSKISAAIQLTGRPYPAHSQIVNKHHQHALLACFVHFLATMSSCTTQAGLTYLQTTWPPNASSSSWLARGI